MRITPILLLACVLTFVLCEEQAQIQVLFYGSEEGKEYPPPGVSWDQPPESWPGHLKQLGSEHPRTKVPVAYTKGFPGAEDFYKNFVERHRPVVFQQGSEDLGVMEALALSKLNNSGLGALTYIEVAQLGSTERMQISLRDFIKRIKEPTYIKQALHKNIKREVILPNCLRCSYLTPLLLDTKHVLIGHVLPLPVLQDESEVLTCVLDGKKEILLVDPRESPEIDTVMEVDQSPYGKASFMNSMRVDYTKYPGAAKVAKYHIAILGPGDCMYIPGGWVRQTNVLSLEHSIDIRWKNEAWNPDGDCIKEISKQAKLSQFSFPAEEFLGIEPSKDKEGKALSKIYRVLDWILNKDISMKELFAHLARDTEVIPDLKNWTAECSERGKEMFEHLDMNKDGVLGSGDVAELTEEKLPRFLGYMEDRLADLLDLASDQKLDGGHASVLSQDKRIEMADTIMRMTRDEL